MAKQHASRSASKKHASDDRQKLRGLANTIIDVAVELEQAADDIKSLLQHVEKATERGNQAMQPIRHAGNKAISAVRKRMSRSSR